MNEVHLIVSKRLRSMLRCAVWNAVRLLPLARDGCFEFGVARGTRAKLGFPMTFFRRTFPNTRAPRNRQQSLAFRFRIFGRRILKVMEAADKRGTAGHDAIELVRWPSVLSEFP